MKVMEAIARGFGISHKNFSLLAILFVFNVLWNLSPIPFMGNVQDPTKMQMSPVVFILSAVFVLINIFIQAGVFGLIKDAIASEGKAPVGNFAKYGGKFYMRLFGMGLLILGGIALAVLIIGALFAIGAIVKNVIVTIITGVIGIVLAVIAMYYLFLLFLSPYALIVDDSGILKAMKTSMAFVKKNLWKVVGLTTLLLLIGLGMGFIVGVASGILSLLIKGTMFQVTTSVLTAAVSSYITIVISAALMLYYSKSSQAS
jgi:hypothetical protein